MTQGATPGKPARTEPAAAWRVRLETDPRWTAAMREYARGWRVPYRELLLVVVRATDFPNVARTALAVDGFAVAHVPGNLFDRLPAVWRSIVESDAGPRPDSPAESRAFILETLPFAILYRVPS